MKQILSGLLALAIVAGPALVAQARDADEQESRPLVIPTFALPYGATGLHATIAGHTNQFVFDTGAGVTLLTPATTALVGCKPWGQVTGFRATGERMGSPRCDDAHFTIQGQPFTAPTTSVLDLQHLMGPAMPPLGGLIGLDLFAGRVITIRPLAHEVVLETPASLQQRLLRATEVPARLVRDAEGVALSVDGAVATPAGRAWMELDTGNGGPLMVDRHVAAPLGLQTHDDHGQQAAFSLIGGIAVQGAAHVGDLIMDGDIGASVLGHWDVTFDLVHGRVWFQPSTSTPTRL